jgi:DNA-binding response OmpR family regulator
MESILIIDDEPSILDWLYEALTGKYDCHTAMDAESALHMMDRREYAAVITDISLPGQSGIELLGTLQQNKPETPVIIISGIYDKAHSQGVVEMGAFGYLPKPFTLPEIDDMLANAVEVRRRGLRAGQVIRARRYVLSVEARMSGFLIFDATDEQSMVMVAGITRDLSQTGVGVIIPRESLNLKRLVGTSFQLVLGMMDGALALDAMIVRYEILDEKRCLVGARFVNLTGRDRMALLVYLQSYRIPGSGDELVGNEE